MLLLNKLKRHEEQGSFIEFGKKGKPDHKVYNFKPNEKGDEVCEVEDETHLKRLLSITEAYEPYLSKDKKAVKPVAAATDTELDEEEDTADTGANPQVATMQKPDLMAFAQEHLPNLLLKPSTPVNTMRLQVTKALAEKAAAEAEANQ